MNAVERYEKYKDEDFAVVLLQIKNGIIKSGKYSKLVKVKDKKIDDKQKEFFNEEEK